MSDILAMREITVFHPKILFRYQFHCRHICMHENVPFACMNPVLMKLSTRVVNWHSNILGYPPTDGSRHPSVFTQYIEWKLMIALGLFWMSLVILFSQWRNLKFCTTQNCIAIFWKYKIQPLFLGKFLKLGVPREIVSRATLGTRAIGSPPLR